MDADLRDQNRNAVSPLVILDINAPLATVRLNGPEKRNALSSEMLIKLAEALEKIASEPDVRLLVLTGEGEAFSAGTDIAALAQLDESDARRVSELGQVVCNQIESFPVPVIAAINGVAAGGGCELALACHLRVAARNATFSLPEIKLGAIPAYGGTQRLAREIGRGRALEMILTGKTISADQAMQFGLVNRVVDREQLLAQTEFFSAEILALAPLAIRACLRAVMQGSEMTFTEGLNLEANLFASLFATNDIKEGTRAFLEKRKPVFRGT